MERYKSVIRHLISYYYDSLENFSGGLLHVVLDDGNIEHANIKSCRDECKNANDWFGVFLADVLLEFSEEELDYMYNLDWWGMNNA
jgi:hypothetical protein